MVSSRNRKRVSRSMMIKAKNIIMKERMWNNRVDERSSRGTQFARGTPTKITCYLNEDQSEFLEERRLKDLVNAFTDFANQ